MLRLRASRLVCGRDGLAVAPPLDLELTAGEALIVTGENGSGKSTLLRTLAGLVAPISGSALVQGAPLVDGEERPEIAARAHYLGHRNALKPALSVRANLAFWQDYLGTGGVSVENALVSLGLAGLIDVPLGHLSAGQQRRVALARLLVAHRPLWLLDEPTAALDAASRGRFAEIVDEHLQAGGLAAIATHQSLGLSAPERELRLERPRLEAASLPELAEADSWA